jgi:hypothetical protein
MVSPKVLRPDDLAITGALYRPICARRAAPHDSGRFLEELLPFGALSCYGISRSLFKKVQTAPNFRRSLKLSFRCRGNLDG